MKFLLFVSCLATLIFVSSAVPSSLIERIKNIKSDRVDSIDVNVISQQVDNFNPQNYETFNNTYLSNSNNFAAGGPIFIVLGGGEIEEIFAYLIQGGHFYDIGVEANATFFAIESRYYGSSRPTPNASDENLQYLTTEQTLADLAHFISYIKQQNPLLANSKVILFGIDLGAAQATWFRKKYPHLVDGVWASSAPLEARVDFYGYYEAVENSFLTLGFENCFLDVQNVFRQINVAFDNEEFEFLQETFDACAPVNGSDANDVASFYASLAAATGIWVESARAEEVNMFCEILQSGGPTNVLTSYAEIVNYIYGVETCHDFSYNSLIERFRDSDWDSLSTMPGVRQNYYSRCTEYARFMTSGAITELVDDRFPIEPFLNSCFDIFPNLGLTAEIISNSIDTTNVKFGGLNPAVTNVIFTNGELDPYRLLGITEDLSASSPAIVIPGYGKSFDVTSVDEDFDSEDLLQAKEKIRQMINQYISE